MRNSISVTRAIKKLRHFYITHKRPPSLAEIRDLFGYKSRNSARFLTDKLIGLGVLKKDRQGKLIFQSPAGIKLLGSIRAGWPSPAEEELIDTMSLDEFMIKNPDQTYLVKVMGDSMIDAGLIEGDLVLVERGREPKSGDIVIAQVDNDWTMKYYEKSGKNIVLKPANERYKTIVPKHELIIGGVIVGSVRKYK